MKRTKPKPRFPVVSGENAVPVCVDIEVIPLLAGVVRKFEQRDVWATDEDHIRANNWAATFQEQLMSNNCLQQLIDEQRRLYRLWDTALNGTQYTAVGDVITPAIPAVPPASVDAVNSMRAHLGRIWHLAENEVAGVAAPGGAGVAGAVELPDVQNTRSVIRSLQGVINAGWFDIGGKNATIADIVNSLRVGSNEKKQSLLDKLSQILGMGSDVASIFNLVEGLLSDTVEATEEGALIGVLIASTMAQSAVIGAQSQHLQRLINALDGGGIPAPTGNILSQLQSTYGNVTLAQLLSAIQASAASGGATEATLAGIAAALGTTADCVTGETVIGLLCRLNDSVGGTPPQTPAPCPGYEAFTVYGPSTFVQATAAGEPAVYWHNGGEAFWQTAGFAITDVPWTQTIAGASLIPTISPLMPAGQSINCCVIIEVTGEVMGLSVQYITALGELAQHQFIANTVSFDTRRITTTLTAGTPYVFQASLFSGGSPVIKLWISREAVG